MLGRDTCGCLYLVCGDVVSLIYPCDHDGHGHQLGISPDCWRRGDAGTPDERLTALPTDEVRKVLNALGALVADGHAMRDIDQLLVVVRARAEDRGIALARELS